MTRNPAFHQLADGLPEPLLLISPGGFVEAINRGAAEALNAPPEQILGQPLMSLVENPESQVERHFRLWSRSRRPLPAPLRWKGNASVFQGWRCQGFRFGDSRKQGRAHVIIRCLPGPLPATEFTALNRELARHKSALRKLKVSREALAFEHEKAMTTLHSIGDAVITTDATGRVEQLNPVAEQLTGWPNEAARGLNITTVFRIVNEYTRETAPDPVMRCLEEGRIVGLANHTTLISRDGREYIIEDSAAPIRRGNDPAHGVVLVFRDVTSDRVARRQLEHLAHHDTLTSLYNRYFFEEELERAVQRANRGTERFAMIYLDLDQFKIVNDTAGHGVGDELLAELGRFLGSRVRGGDVLARLGGDEFGLLAHDIDEAGATAMAWNLLVSLQGYHFRRAGQTFHIGASAGITMLDEHATSAGEVMRQADVACYVAKRQNPGGLHVFSESDQATDSTVGEMRLIGEIRQALAADRFTFAYQPIVRLDNGQVAHYELLLRMTDSEGDIVAPGQFITAAERYGIMAQIDEWVIEHGLAELAARLQAGHDTTFAINLSGASIGEPSVLKAVETALATHRVPPDRVIFEITETAAISRIEKASAFMRQLRQHGCQFALDDFGTGFSSFAYLKQLPVKYLKIDGIFIRDLASDPVDQAMVRAFGEIARYFGLETIAEFVENEEILDALRKLPIDMAQGSRLGQPLLHLPA